MIKITDVRAVWRKKKTKGRIEIHTYSIIKIYC